MAPRSDFFFALVGGRRVLVSYAGPASDDPAEADSPFFFAQLGTRRVLATYAGGAR